MRLGRLRIFQGCMSMSLLRHGLALVLLLMPALALAGTSAKGRVWLDANGNGLRDRGERRDHPGGGAEAGLRRFYGLSTLCAARFR